MISALDFEAIWLTVAQSEKAFVSFIEALKWIRGRDKEAPDDLDSWGRHVLR